jgi:hypothetical protein
VVSFYWSSSEFLAYVAWAQYFDDGHLIVPSKDTTLSVRPVRAF